MNSLKKGDLIGIVCPSHIADEARYRRNVATLKSLGFSVKCGDNIYQNTDGYLASEQERADDFNQMIRDDSVKMVLFGGGEGGNELLPYLDYEHIKKHPKFFLSFSDGTTLLNAIHAMTGVPTYYGQAPGMFYDLRYYDYRHFAAHFVQGRCGAFLQNSPWQVMHGGACEGTLIGGYTRNFALLLGSRYFSYDKRQKHVLFLEDHEKFSDVAKVSSFISHIEQSDFIHTVTGLIFGHYAEKVPLDLLNRLKRFGAKHHVPVVYTDDFGHGVNHAVLPIGCGVQLDADRQQMVFTDFKT